jgi:chemotaxis protein histidine kinase CheA
MGTDVKQLTLNQGVLSNLNTTTKTSLVAAINELLTLIGGSGAVIDDNAGNGDTNVTWSADKIFDSIEEAKTAVKNELIDGSAAALDTLNELAEALGNDPNFATTIATELANRVRFDAPQVLTSPQQAQARTNIGAAAQSDVAGLITGLGPYDHDYAADYAAAKV